MNYYSHHIGDFNNATRHLTRVERALYRDAIELYYDTESVLTKDFEKLSRRLLAHTEEEKEALKTILSEFFSETDDGYFHERCEKEIAKYRANTSNKAKAGIASAEARKNKRTDVEHVLNKCDSVEQLTNNHKPITNNHKQVKATSQKAIAFVLPDWINKNHWDIWHSKGKRKTASVEQKTLAVSKLERWRLEGLDYAKALEDAAEGGWQGLHEPKSKITHSNVKQMKGHGVISDASFNEWLEPKKELING